MRKKHIFTVIFIAFFLAYCSPVAPKVSEQTSQQRPVRKMRITGEIAKADQGYIIRGKVPYEIFTILNPVPTILDEFVKGKKIFLIETRIVSGDNVEIETIDGKEYP